MSTFYNDGKGELLKGNIDLENDTINLAFMDPSYSPDKDSDTYWSDINSNEATDSGGSGIGPVALSNKAVSIDDSNDRAEFDADDVTKTNQTTDTDKFVIYKDTGSASTSNLICSVDIDEGKLQPVDGDLSITFSSEGIFAF